MSESSHQITNVLLRVVADPGHNGPLFEYKIDSHEDGYAVTLRISKLSSTPDKHSLLPSSPSPRPIPPSGGSYVEPSHMTEVLVKERHEVEEFLGRLVAGFNVYELADLKFAYPFLHPTFYTFSFRDAAGEGHSFEYQIECSNHLDERYKALVQEFDIFFESGRVFHKFFASQRWNKR